VRNTDHPVNIPRRRAMAAGLGAAALSALPFRVAMAESGDIVIGAAQPITGVFSFAGVGLNQGLGDYCNWRNEQGGVAGRRLRYISEDSVYKMDHEMAIFKKLMGEYKPPFFFGGSTGWAKVAAKEVEPLNTTLTSGVGFSSELADPALHPYHFIAAPTYVAMGGILLEYISSKASGSSKPSVAIVYSDTEFGRDPIPGIKARAEALQIPIVLEVVTKPGAVDVSSEVAKLRRAKPDYIIFHGYVLAPIPEFIKQMREAGMKAIPMGTIWSMDKTTVSSMGAAAEGWVGVMPYRYSYETDNAPMMKEMADYVSRTYPDQGYITLFNTHTWFAGMIFAEIAERCINADKALTGENMKQALESIENWDTGGIMGLPASLKSHQIPIGRIYEYDVKSELMRPISDWIETS